MPVHGLGHEGCGTPRLRVIMRGKSGRKRLCTTDHGPCDRNGTSSRQRRDDGGIDMLRTGQSGLLAFLVVLLPGVSTAIAADVTLRYAGTLPATHHNGEGQYMLAKRVLELTNGSVEIRSLPGRSTLQGQRDPRPPSSRARDMGYNLTSVWSTDSVSEINDIPFLFADHAHASRAWAPEEIAQGIFREMESRGMKTVHVMFYGSLFDFGNNNRQMKAASDFDGMKNSRLRPLGGGRASGTWCFSRGDVSRRNVPGHPTRNDRWCDYWCNVPEEPQDLGSRQVRNRDQRNFGVMAVNISQAKWTPSRRHNRMHC